MIHQIYHHKDVYFGGGNAAATGEEDVDTSVATVNIVGGEIYGNVYGGANTSVVYGTTNVNIGINASSVTGLTKDDIYIKGTIFRRWRSKC